MASLVFFCPRSISVARSRYRGILRVGVEQRLQRFACLGQSYCFPSPAERDHTGRHAVGGYCLIPRRSADRCPACCRRWCTSRGYAPSPDRSPPRTVPPPGASGWRGYGHRPVGFPAGVGEQHFRRSRRVARLVKQFTHKHRHSLRVETRALQNLNANPVGFFFVLAGEADHTLLSTGQRPGQGRHSGLRAGHRQQIEPSAPTQSAARCASDLPSRGRDAAASRGRFRAP